MKYQQLDNLEGGWKWHYLVQKYRNGEEISRYTEKSAAEEAVRALLTLEDRPAKVTQWITEHLNPALATRLKQTIRARRKRYFNAEHPNSRKKSIDLEFLVWQHLAEYARTLQLTLSDAIAHLLTDAAAKSQYASQMIAIREDLSTLLGSKEN